MKGLLGPAGAAAVDALGLGVGVLTGERALGAGLAQHLVLVSGELFTPLGVALGHLICHETNSSDVSKD